MSDEQKRIEYDWKFDSKTQLEPKEFMQEVVSTIKEAEVVSIGEYHDVEQDKSYEWILDYANDILEAAGHYQLYSTIQQPKKMDTFERCLPKGFGLIDKLASERVGFDDLRSMHVGRLFAVGILPIASTLGFTDIVFEGIDDRNPAVNYERSKDKIGDLLRLMMAMIMGMRIHGAYADTRFSTAVDVGQALKSKIDEVKENDPDARVLVHNGAMHNMTIPYQGEFSSLLGLSIDVSQITYAPDMIEKYGNGYVSLDLLNKKREMPSSHFLQMQQEADEDSITMYRHGIRQKTFIID